jgi:hypothetical protein
MAKSAKKYPTRIGQYTGTSNTSNPVQKSAMRVARVVDNLYRFQMQIKSIMVNDTCQKFHSGNLLMNGLNSSSFGC